MEKQEISFHSSFNDDPKVNKIIFNEASDMIQKISGQREPITEVMRRIFEISQRFEVLCSDVEEIPEQTASDESGYSSDVICC